MLWVLCNKATVHCVSGSGWNFLILQYHDSYRPVYCKVCKLMRNCSCNLICHVHFHGWIAFTKIRLIPARYIHSAVYLYHMISSCDFHAYHGAPRHVPNVNELTIINWQLSEAIWTIKAWVLNQNTYIRYMIQQTTAANWQVRIYMTLYSVKHLELLSWFNVH